MAFLLIEVVLEGWGVCSVSPRDILHLYASVPKCWKKGRRDLKRLCGVDEDEFSAVGLRRAWRFWSVCAAYMHVMLSCFSCKTSSGRAKFHCRSGKGGSDFKYFCCSFRNLREHYVTLVFWVEPLQSNFKQENVVWVWPFRHVGWSAVCSSAEEKGRWGRKGRVVCQPYRSQLYCSGLSDLRIWCGLCSERSGLCIKAGSILRNRTLSCLPCCSQAAGMSQLN